MNKLKNKKGFTLIEMMAVVAIIAILVSIIMPAFTESKNKANAATNAANLRTVESQLSIMLVSNPEAFEKDDIDQAVLTVVDTLNTALDEVLYPALDLAQSVLTAAQNSWLADTSWGQTQIANAQKTVTSWQEEIVATEDVRDRKIYLAKYSYTAVNGIITLEDGSTITAPTSKSLNVDGITVDEGVQMTVVVSDSEILAYYNGLSKNTFAIVADGGSTASISSSAHDYVDTDGDGNCDVCGANKDNLKTHSSAEIEYYN